MVEVELKFPITTGGEMEDTLTELRALGFWVDRRFSYEKTTMYDNGEGVMQETNGRIRVRVVREKDTPHEQIEVSYKKPLGSDDGIKREIEHEFEADNEEGVVRVFEKMGFTPTTSYERERAVIIDSKDYDEQIKVTLDKFPFATYIELEGEEQDIIALATRLGFDMEDNLEKPCDTLFQEWRAEQGLPPKDHIRFEDYAK